MAGRPRRSPRGARIRVAVVGAGRGASCAKFAEDTGMDVVPACDLREAGPVTPRTPISGVRQYCGLVHELARERKR